MKSNDLKYLAEILDSKFKGPFGFRFGLDGIIGLIPGIGDIITSFLSLYIVVRAAQSNYPQSIILRMCLNILIESLVGVVPLFGNLFDFVWRSNEKNLQLIKDYEIQPTGGNLKSKLTVTLFIIGTLAVIAGAIYLAIFLGKNLWGFLQTNHII